MQYRLLKIVASHNRITIVGDDDQVHYSFQLPWNFFVPFLCSLSLIVIQPLMSNGISSTQSIFSFNGADISGFDSFRKDFPNYKEVCHVLRLISCIMSFMLDYIAVYS